MSDSWPIPTQADIDAYQARQAADTTQYEVYREKFRITEWRDGCVYRTESLGCGWFAMPESERPSEIGIMYAAASDEFARNNMTIRKA
jgi:hypothetical protein